MVWRLLRLRHILAAEGGRMADRFWIITVLLLAGCSGGGGGGGSGKSCSPAPSITSTPPTEATVGVQYFYVVRQVKFCILDCGGVVPGTMPPGAVVDSRDVILWTPAASQSGSTVQFKISTAPDV